MLRFTRSVVASYAKANCAATYIPKRNFFDFGDKKNQENKEKTGEAQASEPKGEEMKVEEPKVEEPKVVDTSVQEIASLKTKIAEYTKTIDELKALNHRQELAIGENMKKMKELQERVLSEIAEQENIRERAKKDVNAAKMFGVSSFCKKLLDVSDTLDFAAAAAAKSANKNDEVAKIAEGVVMTQKVFEKVLGDAGVTKYQSLGLKADPNVHDVTAQLADPSQEPGTISFVIKEGYMMHDRVLRPAQVVTVADQ